MKRSVVFFLILLSHALLAQRAVPPLWGHRVHDEAQILQPGTIDELDVLLKNHEDSTSNQIAVLIISSLDGDALEDYSLRVVEEWKLGTAKNDNGVLLLIAVNDRQMRIEVGHGLEGVLTDATASRIIRNEIAPNFRDQQYDAGVKAGVLAIIRAIGGEYQQEAPEKDAVSGSWVAGIIVVVVLGIFTFIGLITPGCAGWFLYAFLIPFYTIFPLALMGETAGLGLLGTYLLGFPILKTVLGRTEWGKRVGKNMRNTRGGRGSGWTSGSGWFTGGGGGWSSGGGGFSGGGGSFGGGGASGSW